jgi:hypothetical protein
MRGSGFEIWMGAPMPDAGGAAAAITHDTEPAATATSVRDRAASGKVARRMPRGIGRASILDQPRHVSRPSGPLLRRPGRVLDS